MNLSTLQSIAPQVTPEIFKKLEKFLDIFLEKNSQINLSAIRDENGVWEKHFFDSLSTCSLIEKHNPKKILDMGTGGGFPTIPLSFVFPEIDFFPVDSVQKKLKVVSAFADEMGQEKIFPLAGRAEDLARDKKYRENFPMVVTRAFAKFSPLLEMTIPFLENGGILLAYRGPENNMEQDEILIEHFGAVLTDIIPYQLPNGDDREIWEITKITPTEKQYPRKVGLPKHEPVKL